MTGWVEYRTITLRFPWLSRELTEPLAAKAFIATALLVLIGGIAALYGFVPLIGMLHF